MKDERETDYSPIASKRLLSPLGGAFAWRGEVLLLTERATEKDEIAQGLRAAGFAVRPCRPEEASVRRVLLRPPVLMVLDIDSSPESALDLVRKLDETLGSLAPPAIAIVSGDDETIFARAFAAGMRDVLARPVSPAILRVKCALHARPQGNLPESVGGYRILRLLGRGGMGTVYL
ncbi:hypothetical protein HY251_02590, partial [bacterium]|nr:hypothetical protein [bacterium]